jgi:small-conductance mechanosensitive channel
MSLIEVAVMVSVGISLASAVVAVVVYLHERQSDREAPLKLSVLLTVFILGGWLLLTALALFIGYLVTTFVF